MAFWQRPAKQSAPSAGSIAGAATAAPPPGAVTISPNRISKKTWGVTYPMRPETGFQPWTGFKGNQTVPGDTAGAGGIARVASEHAGIG